MSLPAGAAMRAEACAVARGCGCGGLRLGAQRLGGGPDVRRRGAAAAADEHHPRVSEPRQVPGEVAAVDGELERARPGAARLPGVRLGADRHRRVADQVLGDDEHPLRPDRAVGADHRDRQRGQHRRDLARRLAAQGVRVVGERGLRDQRQAGDGRGHGDRLDELVQVPERLKDQQVGGVIRDQGEDLLAQHLHPLRGTHPAPLRRGHRRRDRARHQDAASRAVRGGPGKPDARPVDLGDLVGEAVVGEPEPVRAERVGLDDVRAGDQVAVVDGGDKAGIGQVELGQRPVKCRARRVQHSAHGAVAYQYAIAREQLRRRCRASRRWPAHARSPPALLSLCFTTTRPQAARRGSRAPPGRSAGPGNCRAGAR